MIRTPPTYKRTHTLLPYPTLFLSLVHVNRNAAAVILDRDRAIGVEFDQHQVAMPGQCLVDGIVRNLEHHVVQARSIVGIADIHSWALAHCIEAFERSEEHTSELQSLMRISYAVFCLKKKINN